MTATKSVTWTTKKGNIVEVTIERTKELRDKYASADGDKVKCGEEMIDELRLTMTIDGKYKAKDNTAPIVIVGKVGYEKIEKAGGYARLGDSYIGKENYELIVAAITELETELGPVSASNEELQNEEQTTINSPCPKCGTWCYGDCDAS